MRSLSLVALALLTGCAHSRRTVSTDQAPRAIGPYSQAVAVGDLVLVSGQIALDPATGNMVEGDIREQTDRALRNIAAVLAAAGLSMKHIARTTVYMVDLGEFEAMNRVYATWFPDSPPARATVQVAALPKGARIEIDAIAHR